MKNATKQAEAKNGKTETKALTVVKADEKAQAQEPKPLTIEERIAQVQQLSKLIEQRNNLKSNLFVLEQFRLGDDQTATSMTLSDGESKWQFSNTYLLAKVVGLLQDEFTAKIAEVEVKINLAA